MMDGEVEVDLDAIMQNIDEAEVVSVYFPLLRKTLLLDTRSGDDFGPMLRVVPMVSNSVERYRSVRRLRPQLPRPHSITTIPWTRRVEALEELGVWRHVLARLQGCGLVEPDAYLQAAERCFCELMTLEQREMRRAITGDQYRTLWDRPGPTDRY